MSQNKGWEEVGVGHIDYNPAGNPRYIGTMPFQKGDEVMMFNIHTVNKMMQDQIGLLKNSYLEMPPELFDVKAKSGVFPDAIGFNNTRTNQKRVLYLDRKLYIPTDGRELWVRYVGEGLAFEEERGDLENLVDLDNLQDEDPDFT